MSKEIVNVKQLVVSLKQNLINKAAKYVCTILQVKSIILRNVIVLLMFVYCSTMLLVNIIIVFCECSNANEKTNKFASFCIFWKRIQNMETFIDLLVKPFFLVCSGLNM